VVVPVTSNNQPVEGGVMVEAETRSDP
jgi:hypothetical protein